MPVAAVLASGEAEAISKKGASGGRPRRFLRAVPYPGFRGRRPLDGPDIGAGGIRPQVVLAAGEDGQVRGGLCSGIGGRQGVIFAGGGRAGFGGRRNHMVQKSIAAIITFLAALPVAATSAERTAPPAGSADARYCLRVEPATGSLVETVRCWTRQEWTEQGVDLDQAWGKEGVAVKKGANDAG